MKELKVGQKIWIRYKGFDKWRKSDPSEVVITKIGRKYFEVATEDGYRKGKYEIETMLESVYSNYRNKAYLSLKEINDEDEKTKLSNKIKNKFNSYGELPFSLDQLKKIDEIITQQ